MDFIRTLIGSIIVNGVKRGLRVGLSFAALAVVLFTVGGPDLHIPRTHPVLLLGLAWYAHAGYEVVAGLLSVAKAIFPATDGSE